MEQQQQLPPPEGFVSIICDFARDLHKAFPEFAPQLEMYLKPHTFSAQQVFDFCLQVYPERFFDILYQNEEMFSPTSTTSTIFLPEIDFKVFFVLQGVTAAHHEAIWKYLQLIMFSLLGKIDSSSAFGDTANLFEAVDKEELRDKIYESVHRMEEMMMGTAETTTTPESTTETAAETTPESTTETPFTLPQAKDLHEKLSGILDGKLGRLAKELAEDVSKEFADDSENAEFLRKAAASATASPKDIIQQILKNPKKFTGIIKKVGNKIDQKLQSGEITKGEMMEEARDIMGKMKDMPFMDNMNDFIKQFGKNLGKKMKVDTNALDRMTKQNNTKDRLRARLQKIQQLRTSGSGGGELQQPQTQTQTQLQQQQQQPKRKNNKKK